MRPLRAAPALFLSILLTAPLAAQEGAGAAADSGAAPAADRTPDAALAGVVREAGSGEPLAEALVVLPERGVGTYTDSTGRFAFADLPPGETVLEVRFLGRRSEERTVRLRSHEVTEVDLSLATEAVEVPGLTVEAERRRRGRMAGFHQRMEKGRGHFFTREELAKREGNQLHNILRAAPNINAVPCQYLRASRKTPSCYVLDAGGNRRPTSVQGGPCVPQLFVDGRQTSMVGLSQGINELRASEIEAIEVYASPSQVPARFASGVRGSCGAVVVWTRDPDTAPRG